MNIGSTAISKMPRKIGVIAEDRSDVDVVAVILEKYLEKSKFKIKQFVGNGCGKLKHKCDSWAHMLFQSGCEHVFLFHDLDRHKEPELRNILRKKLPEDKFPNSVIIIPVKEIEAWLLSDSEAIKTAFSLPKLPKKIANCDAISSPKDHLKHVVYNLGKQRYINSVHNKRISEYASLDNLRRCVSFSNFDEYVLKNICT